MRPVVQADHHRHHPPGEVERDLIDLLALGNPQRSMQVRVLEHAAIHHIPQPGLKVAVEVGQGQHRLAVVAVHVAVPFQQNAVGGQRAGLVGAQHIHRPQVLNRIQPLDHQPPPRQLHRPPGEADRHNHRQHLGGQPHGDRQGKQQRLVPVAMGPAIQHEHRGDQHRHEPQHQPGELRDAPLETAGRNGLAHRLGQ